MRVAVISDIHSNLEALQTVGELLPAEQVDEIVCLGDVVGYGANPNECVDIARALTPHVLLGNHDEAATGLSRVDEFNPFARAAAVWTHAVLTAENKKFLRARPYSLVIDGLLFFVHASPREPAEWNYIITRADALENFPAFTERVCFVGHSHVPGIFSEGGKATGIEREKRYIINVGSVGQPRDGDRRLSFGVFDTETWSYKNIRADYDVRLAADKIRKNGLPASLADRLLHGR